MPCRDYQSDSSYAASQVDELKAQNDRLARIACEAMTKLTEFTNSTSKPYTYTLTRETHEWWTKHQEADKAEQLRKAREAAKARKAEEAAKRRQAAINSLTKEQREALGF